MACDRKTAPEFTRAQITECENCKHASGKKVWCCLFGVWIKEPPLIATPEHKILLPGKGTMAKNFGRDALRYLREGRPKRTPAEQLALRAICQQCEDFLPTSKIGPRCRVCGCSVTVAVRWATKHCPRNKW